LTSIISCSVVLLVCVWSDHCFFLSLVWRTCYCGLDFWICSCLNELGSKRVYHFVSQGPA
jgi:hypothetical protein